MKASGTRENLMLTSIFTSMIAYIGTNMDDVFVIMILLAQSVKGTKGQIVAGHFLGIGILTVISMLGAFGLQNLPLQYVGILGLVPIGFGIKSWMDHKKERVGDDAPDAQSVRLLSMAMITLGNGADNVGVYISLFTGTLQTKLTPVQLRVGIENNRDCLLVHVHSSSGACPSWACH